MQNHNSNWWKEGVVYQIYPRSFKDGNNDGMGDLKGIIEKLDYLKELGVDIVWLCPVYESPNDDNGYDVSDYRSISPEFGTMEEFDELLEGLHSRGIRLIMDLVVNHSSDEHKWFQEALASKDSPYRDYYIWRKGKDGGPPNNWIAFFGGSAWEYDEKSDEYYLHLFSPKQPDLNWENEKLREEVYDIMHFWLKKGVDGFRMDVITFISKYQDFPDIDLNDFFESVNKIYANGPRVHEFLKEMNDRVLSKYDVMTVGEATGVRPEQGILYVGEDRKELNMIFHLDHMFMNSGPGGRFDTVHTDLKKFKDLFRIWDDATKENGWISIFLGNHDFPRAVSRFGNDKEHLANSSKLLAMLVLSMRGTPYIYQGDEIGMRNIEFSAPEELRDLESVNYFRAMMDKGEDVDQLMERINFHGRDNSRTPIQWNSEKFAGFSSVDPWIKVHPDYINWNAERQIKEEDSIFNFHKRLIRLRKETPALVYGKFELLESQDSHLFEYLRLWEGDTYRVILNFSSETISIDEEQLKGELLISNYHQNSGDLQPWEGRIIKLAN